MKKDQVISQLTNAHRELQDVLDQLSKSNTDYLKIKCGGWTIKDILSHLIEWKHRFVSDFDEILSDSQKWEAKIHDQNYIEEVNQQAVKIAKQKSDDWIYQNWQESLDPVIKKINSLTPSQWQTILKSTLFDYRYHGALHEAGHAKEILAANSARPSESGKI